MCCVPTDQALPCPVELYVPAPDRAHVYVTSGGRDFYLWHMLSGRSVHTFRGKAGGEGRGVEGEKKSGRTRVSDCLFYNFITMITIKRPND